MNSDEQKIRELIETWMRASAAEDSAQLKNLMAEDVVFLLPGQPPMRGRDSFFAASELMRGRFRLEGKSEVVEIQVAGDFAYCWTHLSVTITSVVGGLVSKRAGHTLTVLRKETDGRWVVFRDANLLTAV